MPHRVKNRHHARHHRHAVQPSNLLTPKLKPALAPPPAPKTIVIAAPQTEEAVLPEGAVTEIS